MLKWWRYNGSCWIARHQLKTGRTENKSIKTLYITVVQMTAMHFFVIFCNIQVFQSNGWRLSAQQLLSYVSYFILRSFFGSPQVVVHRHPWRQSSEADRWEGRRKSDKSREAQQSHSLQSRDGQTRKSSYDDVPTHQYSDQVWQTTHSASGKNVSSCRRLQCSVAS